MTINTKSQKILIVDDEADIIEFVQFNLEKEKFVTETASDGNQAIKIAKTFVPDLILLDIMMPGKDGIETCKVLRTMPELNQTLIVFLTARNEDFVQISSFDAGGDDFIAKPIRPQLLVSKVKSLLRRNEKNEGKIEPNLTIGNLTINVERVEVAIDDVIINLPKKEFELLYLLASKPGKVFSREEIYRKIWGSEVIVGHRTIDVHIRKIREKMGIDLIKTIKGLGYKFDY